MSLRHRTAEDVLQQLQPLVEPGGALGGSGDKLFLRASPRNAADIRRALEAIDRPPRRLMISVRQGGAAAEAKVGAGATVILSPGDSSVRARLGERSQASRESVSQQVQTIDGGRAFIQVGRSLFLPMRQIVLTPAGAVVSETVARQDIGTGFYAAPRVAGERVSIDISPMHDTPGPLPGSVNTRRIVTTASGRLGEWLPLGGSERASEAEAGGTLRYGTRDAREETRVWLRVEALPD